VGFPSKKGSRLCRDPYCADSVVVFIGFIVVVIGCCFCLKSAETRPADLIALAHGFVVVVSPAPAVFLLSGVVLILHCPAVLGKTA
jgi:uncharacterized membrane protein